MRGIRVALLHSIAGINVQQAFKTAPAPAWCQRHCLGTCARIMQGDKNKSEETRGRSERHCWSLRRARPDKDLGQEARWGTLDVLSLQKPAVTVLCHVPH